MMSKTTAALEALLDLNLFSGSVSDVLPLLVIPAVCCLALTWKYTERCFRLPALLSTDPLAMEMLGCSFGLRLLQTAGVVLVMYNAVYYGTRPEVTFSDDMPPNWTLRMSFLNTIAGRLASQAYLSQIIYTSVSNRSKLLATFFGSVILVELVYYFLSIYAVNRTLGNYITTNRTLGDYITAIVLGQTLSLPFEFSLVSVVGLCTISARRERKAQLSALLKVLLCGSLLPLLFRVSYAIYPPLGLVLSHEARRRMSQAHILTEFYVLGSLYPIIRLPVIPIFAVSEKDAGEHPQVMGSKIELEKV